MCERVLVCVCTCVSPVKVNSVLLNMADNYFDQSLSVTV